MQVLLVCLAATAALVVANLHADGSKIPVWLQICKLSGKSSAKWAAVGWLLIGEPIYLSLVIVSLRLGLLKQDLKLFYLGVLLRHRLLEQSYMRTLNSRRPMFGDQFLYAIKWLHIVCGAKWPNDQAQAQPPSEDEERKNDNE